MRIDNFRRLIIAALTLLFSVGGMISAMRVSFADVKIGGPVGDITIWITNTISKKDAAQIAQREVDFRGGLQVNLNSPGGDVDAAMQIGRIIRRSGGLTVVPPNMKCFSSCALIYIGGVVRLNAGSIGLHRPFFASAPQSKQTIERELPLMLQRLKSYVQEMGVTDNFYQEMVNTEPARMNLYGNNIQALVPTTDPTFDEITIAYDARKYGVDTSEMRIRQRDTKSCNDPSTESDCSESIRWGLSERVYKERKAKASICLLPNEEIRTLARSMGLQWKDHPTAVKSEVCFRNIMLGR